MTNTERKALRELGKLYYKNYLQGRNVSNSLIDSVNFTGSQAGEIRLHNSHMIPKFPEQIRNAKNIKISNDKPERLDATNFNKLYNSFKNKNYEYIIRNNSNKSGNDFYQIKEVGSNPAFSGHNRVLKPEPNNIINNDNLQNLNPIKGLIPFTLLENQFQNNEVGSSPTYSYHNRAFELEPNSIINDNLQNLNPTKGLLPFSFLNNKILEGGIEMNIDVRSNPIFTIEQIGAMSQDEFLQNESSIMEQLRQGNFNLQSFDYTGYTNPKSGSNKIFSREDIGNMSGNEYNKFEKEINAQLNSIGIPTMTELNNSSGTVFVNAYTKDDGTEVRSHFRSKPSR